jgi:histidinol-phosphate/aromatic aminotransferase/cobyric acid decarboxylase-like protein/adenosyl cobinamide kinase/adenosyl cobinamide phosphate guanylyltransferase
MTLTLVIGGTRSGKSAHAERLALEAAGAHRVRYVATADASDGSMAERIRRHVERRPATWETVQAGDALAASIATDGTTLIDGLGTWIAGALHRGTVDVAAEIERVIETAAGGRRLIDAAAGGDVIVVAEEAGQGLLPGDPISRNWLDALGDAVQRLSAAADRVDYVVAGRVIRLGAGDGGYFGGFRGEYGPSGPQSLPGLRHHGDRDVRPGDADHAVNVLAGGPPDWLMPALRAAIEDPTSYPVETEAIAAIATRHGRHPDEVVVTNGAAEALWLLAPALRPRLAVCVHPGFTEAEAALRAHQIEVVRVYRDPDRGFALDPTQIPVQADLVIVGNPASPSGTLDPAAAIQALRARGRVVVVDEAFMEMVPGEPGSLAREPLDDVIVIRSLTKVLSIPGLRAGYALAPPHLAVALHAVRPPWSANTLALTALKQAAEHPADLRALAERATAEREDLERRLRELDGVRAWPSAANFCLIEVQDGPHAVRVLHKHRIAVRSAVSFPGLGSNHIRITARDPQANERLVTVLHEAVSTAVPQQ